MTAVLLLAAVSWVSNPVRPGEHVYVAGSGWGGHPQVEIGGATVAPDLVTDRSLVFRLPSGAATPSQARIVSDGRVAGTFAVNAPEVWWLEGDDFERSTPGGRLRAFGRALDGCRFVLRNAAGRAFEPRMDHVDTWEASCDCDVPEGTYEVSLVDRSGTAMRVGAWTVAVAQSPWKTNVFDIVAFGAVANDDKDDTPAVRAALEAAARNGGGVVHVPRGRFGVTGNLKIPPRTVLQGVSERTSQLYWADTMTPPPALVYLTKACGIRNLFLQSGQFRNGIESLSNAHDLVLENLVMRFVTDQQRDRWARFGETNFLARYRMPGDAIKIYPKARRVRLENCDLYRDKDGCGNCYYLIDADWTRIANCRFAGTGFSSLDGRNCVVEDTRNIGNTLSFRHGVHNLFVARNELELKFGGDREGFTTDGSPKAIPGWGPRDSEGSGWTNHVERTRLQFVDNAMRDCTVAIQLYGGGRDVVMARNRCARAGGFEAYGLHSRWPAHNIEFYGNVVEEGNSLRGPFNQPEASDSYLGSSHLTSKPEIVLNRHFVMKNNVIESNGRLAAFAVAGALIENNIVRDSDVGLEGGRFNPTLFVGSNRFERVVQTYRNLEGAVLEGVR